MVRLVVDLSGIVSSKKSEADRKVNLFITTADPIWYFGVASIVIGHVFGVVLAHDRAPGRLWSSCRSVPIRAGRIDDRPGLARAGRFWRDEEEIVRKETTDVD